MRNWKRLSMKFLIRRMQMSGSSGRKKRNRATKESRIRYWQSSRGESTSLGSKLMTMIATMMTKMMAITCDCLISHMNPRYYELSYIYILVSRQYANLRLYLIRFQYLQFQMSSQSQSGGAPTQQNQKKSLRKKVVVETIVPEKKTRRSRRKQKESDQQYALPQIIPISDEQQIITFRSSQRETSKAIIRLPLPLFKKEGMDQETWIQIEATIIEIKIKLADSDTIVISGKIPEGPVSANKKQKNSEEDQEEEEKVYNIWGRAHWVSSREVVTKINKQSHRTLSSKFEQITKIKTKDVISDIFISLNFKQRVECTTEYNGLINQGNTCYMNSYLQMLNHISEFKNLVFEADIGDQLKFPATLQVLFYRLAHDQKPVSAEQLVKSFGWSKKFCRRNYMKLVLMENTGTCRSYFLANSSTKSNALKQVPYIIYSDFRSVKQEPFFDLQLSLSKNLEQSLNDYFSDHLLIEDNMYDTEIYGKQPAKKSAKIQVLPPVLMIQLKRFQFSPVTYKNEKVMHKFEYPNEIDFSKWLVSSDSPQVYRLYAVLVHEGTKAESGHYYVYLNIDNNWYRFNDQQVSLVSEPKVFAYNYGGKINVIDMDSREMRVHNREIVSSSTAYMLVYVKKDMFAELLTGEVIYPTWLRQKQLLKQEERQTMKMKKNYYNGVMAMSWDKHFKGRSANLIGIVPRNTEEQEDWEELEQINKMTKVQQWLQKYNSKGVGVYLYLTTTQKIEFECLLNLQERKTSSFQQTIKDPNCPIIFIFFPFIVPSGSYLFVIKLLAITSDKKMPKKKQDKNTEIIFDSYIDAKRTDTNTDLINSLDKRYQQQGYAVNYFYEEKKQLKEIVRDNNFVAGPSSVRNILGVIIVEKIKKDTNDKLEAKAKKTDKKEEQCQVDVRSWYNNLKNTVDLVIRSEDGKYEFDVTIDQTISIPALREIIFSRAVKQDEKYLSPENIVLKVKTKKTSKTYVELTSAKTAKDLIKGYDKQKIILFGSSSLNADQRVNQIEIKVYYRFQDFSYSDPLHLVVDKKISSDSPGVSMYEKISNHSQIEKFLQIEDLSNLKVLLFTKDRCVINDIVSEDGYIAGKGQISSVMQKEKGATLVVQGCNNIYDPDKYCPILLHHKSQGGDRIGRPRYLEVERTTKLTQLHQMIVQLIKDEKYEWEDKIYPINPMKLYIYAYIKDINKGIEIEEQFMDEDLEVHKMKERPASLQAIQPNDNNNDNQEEKRENDDPVNQQNPKTGPKGDKTIDTVFPKARVLKVSVFHLYLVKTHNQMKINVQ